MPVPNVRYITRPSGMSQTPKRIRDFLGAERSFRIPNRQNLPIFDWKRDFLISPNVEVDATTVPNELWSPWTQLRFLSHKDKGQQRAWMSGRGIKTPNDYPPHSNLFIRRPNRHHSGQGYEVLEGILDGEGLEYGNGEISPVVAPEAGEGHYVSPLFPKTHEYRILMHKGTIFATLVKRAEGISIEQPWNHANGSTFVTVNRPENNRLRHTTIERDLTNCPVLRTAHLLGVDVLYNKEDRSYAVTEINFAPSLTIPANLEALKNVIESC